MLFFLLSCLSFLLSKFLTLRHFFSWVNDKILFNINFLINCKRLFGTFGMLSAMSSKKSIQKLDHDGEKKEFSALLDLPELALECILGKLSPCGLCNMASVCSSLRERCKSDHLWETHLKEKWGNVIGQAAYREWKWFIASQKDLNVPNIASQKSKGWISSLACMWPFSWFYTKDNGVDPSENSFPVDSVMSFYVSLESGKFWFPAQVYNREHGHVGFMLSCYDAELNYDRQTDTFRARYPPHGRRTIVTEEGVEWERLRAPPVDTPAHDLHASDCLNELRPGDHIEIQWRRNKEFPYGWWYGIVGHLEVCHGNDLQCCCHANDTVILEFNQYSPSSRWRRTSISRKEHREEGSEAGGFYGGIRKLDKKEEILMWKKLWPTQTLE